MDFEYSNASVSECDRLQSVGLRKVSALNLDMGRFDFARDNFDGIFKNSIALKWLSPTGWSRSQQRSGVERFGNIEAAVPGTFLHPGRVHSDPKNDLGLLSRNDFCLLTS